LSDKGRYMGVNVVILITSLLFIEIPEYPSIGTLYPGRPGSFFYFLINADQNTRNARVHRCAAFRRDRWSALLGVPA